MDTHFLFDLLNGYKPFEEIAEEAGEQDAVIAASGLTPAQKVYLACALSVKTGRQILYLTDSEKNAGRAVEDMNSLLGGGISQFPAREITFFQEVAASREVSCRRLETMHRLIRGETRAVVAPVDSLLHRVMPRSVFNENTLSLRVGDEFDFSDLSRRLLHAGYSRESIVEGKGQFSVRGGIVDVYPSDASAAVRLEFFDTEIDSIRTFDVFSQRSIENLQDVVIPPASEAPIGSRQKIETVKLIREAMSAMKSPEISKNMPAEDEQGEKNEAPEIFTRESRTLLHFKENMENALNQFEEGVSSRILEKYIHMMYDETESICGYMNHPIVILDEPDALFSRIDNKVSEYNQAFTSALERGEAVREQEPLYLDKTGFKEILDGKTILIEMNFLKTVPEFRLTRLCQMGGTGAIGYSGNTRDMISDVRRWTDNHWKIAVLAGGSARGERISRSFRDEGFETEFDENGMKAPAAGECRIYPISLSESFQFPEYGIAVIAEGDSHSGGTAKKRFTKKESAKIESFTDLQAGDYVVHETFGIGQYLGMTRLTSEGASRDYMMVRYQGEDKLYIPMDAMDRIQKYIGSGESAPPKLSKMGGRDWDKQKNRVRESVKELAFSLVQLYAARQKNKGHAFGLDTPWQREFEENFPYEETPDQLQASEEIKHDMEQERPMDRLLCGDVGYGKTEVALRAAFKAVLDGKQVAILAPTTILVQQHYNTILRRFEGFPVRADVLSRFRTPKQQKETIVKLKNGETDIIVGTHRLLSKEVSFKNLGLLIVDEEQRFGVGHKETIKNLKQSVDVLTLSATPIPRTLHMSMVGIRDMSLLETPPQARFPVQTYVMEYQENVIRDAILREIGRNGQVYFLYNSVETIDKCYDALHALVPEARIAVAHGQMKEHMLEDIMMDFSQQKYDVLLCTTIIESGLDIPMANTLIVYDADRFGLAQLYQTRGRVGRSSRLAYAYLTVRPGKVLSEISQKRLDTIREFTEFGSGFRIAMRDLELRGAGNLLGAEQSGHLADIGYDLYCKLLEEAVCEVQGKNVSPNRELNTQMNVHVNAYLPQDYVPGEKLRIEVYKRIATVSTAAQRDDVEEELLDRFGEEPKETANLVAVAYLKAMCGKLGIERVNQMDGKMEMRFAEKAEVDGVSLFKALTGFDRRMALVPGTPVKLVFTDAKLSRDDQLHTCVRMMERLLSKMGLDGEQKNSSVS